MSILNKDLKMPLSGYVASALTEKAATLEAFISKFMRETKYHTTELMIVEDRSVPTQYRYYIAVKPMYTEPPPDMPIEDLYQ